MPNSLPIQIALQGGGAKLSALLAAMEAVQALHRKKTITVTRVAGTSAGAIVACLFAADVELGRVRERLKRFSSAHWEKLFPKSKSNAAWKLFRGRPLWSDQFFQDELAYFFEAQGVRRLEEIFPKYNVQPILIATNLREADSEVYMEGNLIQKIMDSCALPYCFRVWNRDQSPIIVDGGICENLPSDVLAGKDPEFGQVFGISFKEEAKRNPNSVITFTYALLDAAISHSVKRSRASLGSANVFQIPTIINTFDFPFAFSDASDAEYARIRQESDKFFSNITSLAKPVPTVTGYEWSLQNKTMVSLGKIFESHHMNTRLKYLGSSLEVTANSLLDPPEDDYVRHSVTFRTLDEPIQCMGFSLNADHDFSLEETKFRVYKKKSLEPVETIHLPSIAGTEGTTDKTRKRLIVYFLPPLPANSEEYEITLRDVVTDFMKPLREEKNDSLSITPYLTEESIDKFSIVLHVPEKRPDIKMIQASGLGHKMNSAELASFTDLKGFKSFGWVAENIRLDQLSDNDSFKVELFFSK